MYIFETLISKLASVESGEMKALDFYQLLWENGGSIKSDGQLENHELKEITANKQPIGHSDHHLPFTTHSIDYKENLTFYLFTDGFADQFGGPKGKKFKCKHFKTTLLNSAEQDLEKQKDKLDQIFENWKGELEQVDDVCLIGIRI